jgi:hypothetical protein
MRSNSGTADRLGDVMKKLGAFRSTLDRLGRARDPLQKALNIAGAVAEVIRRFSLEANPLTSASYTQLQKLL